MKNQVNPTHVAKKKRLLLLLFLFAFSFPSFAAINKVVSALMQDFDGIVPVYGTSTSFRYELLITSDGGSEAGSTIINLSGTALPQGMSCEFSSHTLTVINGNEVLLPAYSPGGRVFMRFTTAGIGACFNITPPGTTSGITVTLTSNPVSVESAPTHFLIGKKNLSIGGGISANNKMYDGTTAVTFSGGTLGGLNCGDDVSFVAGGTFIDKNVGDNKGIITNFTLTGTHADRYHLLQPTLAANITAREVTIEVDDLSKCEGEGPVYTNTDFNASGTLGADAVSSITISCNEDNAFGLPGTYNVTGSNPAGTGLTNYFFTFVSGQLTIHGIPSVASTVPSSRCGTGTVSLGATASSGTINWYDAASGGNLVGSGSNFTTPSIASTTAYYAEASDNGCSSTRQTVLATVIGNTRLVAAACGSTLTAFNDKIYANNISGASDYRFEVTQGGTTVEIDRTARYFYITQVAGYDYDKTYTVRVKAKVNGFWGCYGTSCTVSTPARPTTSISAAYCGISLPTIDTRIFAYSVSTATAYRFRVTNGASVQTVDKATNVFRLTDLGTYNFGTAYTVDVAYEVNGVFGQYGSSCVISTPAIQPATQVQASQCGATLATTTAADKIYANSIPTATRYRFEVSYGGNTQVIERTVRYFFITQYSGWQHNRRYTIRVATEVNGNWGTYGPACDVTTPASGMQQDHTIYEANGNLPENISLEAYPNPNNGDFTLSSTHAGELNIINELGQLVQRVELTSENNFKTRVEGLDKGLYFVSGTLNGELFTEKIIVR